MHFGRLSCLFNRHRAQRRSVHWSGLNYEGKCRTCGEPVHRTITGGWRVRAQPAKPAANAGSATNADQG